MTISHNFGEAIANLHFLLNEANDAEFAENFNFFKEQYKVLEDIVITNKGFAKSL